MFSGNPLRFTPPRDFSYRFLMITLLSIGPFGAVFGYVLWIGADSERYERFQMVVSRAGGLMIFALLVAFPSAWWQIGHSMGVLMVVGLLGSVTALTMFAVAASWGIIHLVRHIAFTHRHSSKTRVDFGDRGVWDRELDQG